MGRLRPHHGRGVPRLRMILLDKTVYTRSHSNGRHRRRHTVRRDRVFTGCCPAVGVSGKHTQDVSLEGNTCRAMTTHERPLESVGGDAAGQSPGRPRDGHADSGRDGWCDRAGLRPHRGTRGCRRPPAVLEPVERQSPLRDHDPGALQRPRVWARRASRQSRSPRGSRRAGSTSPTTPW